MNNILYLLEMQKIDDCEDSHYLVGVFSTRVAAEQAGEIESAWTNKKYAPYITEFEQIQEGLWLNSFLELKEDFIITKDVGA